jgi:sugar lactone lactonase YvrE
MGSDGIAPGRRGTSYYRPLTGRQLYSVATDALLDRSCARSGSAPRRGTKATSGAADGLDSDAAGNLYTTNSEHNAVLDSTATGGERR